MKLGARLGNLMPIGEVIKDTGSDIICPRWKIQLKNGATMERMSDSFRLFCIVEDCEDYPCETVKTQDKGPDFNRRNNMYHVGNDTNSKCTITKRQLALFVIILMLVNVASAGTIKEDVANLTGLDQIHTLVNVYNFLDATKWNYKFYSQARGAELAWKEKKGDCTDKSMILVKMLQAHNITAKVVYGQANGKAHNWVRVTIDVDPTCPGCERIYFHDGLW